jgi:hypothetical protein
MKGREIEWGADGKGSKGKKEQMRGGADEMGSR